MPSAGHRVTTQQHHGSLHSWSDVISKSLSLVQIIRDRRKLQYGNFMFKINKPSVNTIHECIVTFKLKNILYNGEPCEMLIMKDETITLNYLETKRNVEVMDQL
jgi:hypothetical protein